MERMHFSPPENLYLHRFFDGVDQAVSRESASGRVAYEEFLTPTLGRLLDEASPFQTLLSYSLQDLNRDLAKCGSGNHVSIQFETHEHSKSYSGRVSHADLGIVVRIEPRGSAAPIEKSILVESKRLYPLRKKYTIHSRYEGFSKDQYLSLKILAGRYRTADIYYFLYNPQLAAFDEDTAIVIRAKENQLAPATGSTNVTFRINDDRWAGSSSYWSTLPGVEVDADMLRQRYEEYTARRPGLRVISLTALSWLIEKQEKGQANKIAPHFSLAQCYEIAPGQWHRFDERDNVRFVSFSSFIVDLLLGCFCGSTNNDFTRVAEGRAPDPSSDTPTLAKHTLRVVVESTLPHVE